MNSRRVINLCVYHVSVLFPDSYLLEVPEWVPATVAHLLSPSQVLPRTIITCAECFSPQTISLVAVAKLFKFPIRFFFVFNDFLLNLNGMCCHI